MNLNLHQLDAFVRVAKLGGFSRAADQMHLSQAGISILIRKLEHRLAVQLFERTTRTVSLTAAGSNLLPIAERMLQDAHGILHSSERELDRQNIKVSLALPPLLASTMLPGILQQLKSSFPRATVAFRECVGQDLVSRIYSRDVDFALAFGSEENTELECRPIGRDFLSVAFCADHALAKKARIRWNDLLPHPLIVSAPGSGARTLAENAFSSMEEALRPAYETSNHITAVSLAQQGLGVAVVSSCMARLAHSMDVVLRPLQSPLIARSLDVVKRRSSTLSAPSLALIELFGKALIADANSVRKSRPLRQA